jgi:hypothetical protein
MLWFRHGIVRKASKRRTTQALFTDDGIMTTTDKTYDLYWGGTHHLGT